MVEETLVQFLFSHAHQLGEKLVEHINLSLSATLIATLLGVPLGIWINQQPKIRNTVLGLTSVFQTIPSLALLAFLIPLLGIGIKPTLVALTIYALLPITRNTFIGLNNIAPEYLEAARGLGFTYWQHLYMIEMPLALPVIIAGIRTATTMTIGITTIAAFIGAGGLGDFITQGLSLDDSRLILLGAIPAAILALIMDYIIAQVESMIDTRKRSAPYRKIKVLTASLAILGLTIIMISENLEGFYNSNQNTIVIATKNFTEQFILGDMMADLITAKTKLKVIKKFNLGTTTIIQNSLEQGAVDLYPEYTGTAYIVVLKHKKRLDPKKTYEIVKQEYKKKFNLVWLQPFGFNNSQTLAIRQHFAKKYNINDMNELVPFAHKLTIAAPAEFLKRLDAFPGLKAVYHFKFKKILQVQPDLMYRAIANKSVDVIAAFSTDGRISAYHLKTLNDNKRFYPPYYAAPVIRESVLQKHPEIEKALAPLAHLIDNKTMQHLNYEADVLHKSPALVARQFLIKKGLLPSQSAVSKNSFS